MKTGVRDEDELSGLGLCPKADFDISVVLLSGAGWLVGWIVDYEVIYLDSQVVSY
jgi:hypothetical protein